MPCRPVEVHWLFGGPYCRHFNGRRVRQTIKQQEAISILRNTGQLKRTTPPHKPKDSKYSFVVTEMSPMYVMIRNCDMTLFEVPREAAGLATFRSCMLAPIAEGDNRWHC
jgi:hypothetical protein